VSPPPPPQFQPRWTWPLGIKRAPIGEFDCGCGDIWDLPCSFSSRLRRISATYQVVAGTRSCPLQLGSLHQGDAVELQLSGREAKVDATVQGGRIPVDLPIIIRFGSVRFIAVPIVA